MGQESDRLLRELVEKEDIRDLVHRYCWAVDRGELQDVRALFHDSCDLIVSPPGRRREGRAAVERWYGRYMRHRLGVLRHLIHNQVITLDGDRAFSKSYFDAVGDLKGENLLLLPDFTQTGCSVLKESGNLRRKSFVRTSWSRCMKAGVERNSKSGRGGMTGRRRRRSETPLQRKGVQYADPASSFSAVLSRLELRSLAGRGGQCHN